MGYSFSPTANEDPRVSQGKLLRNFTKINSDYSVNHVALTQFQNQGFHTLVQFNDVQGSDPGLASPASSLYTKDVSGASELFFQNDSTANDVFQLTNLVVDNTGDNYTVVTPLGIQIQMGKNNTGSVTYATAFPSGYQLYTLLTSGENATRISVTSPLNTGFTWSSVSGNTIYYLVLGSAT